MKYLLISTALFSSLLTASSLAQSTFLERTLVKSEVCLESLNTLVDEKAFKDVKFLVDNKCNILIGKGWVNGKTSKASTPVKGVRQQCKHAFHAIKDQPKVKNVAKTFISNACYPVNPDKFDWKNTQSD